MIRRLASVFVCFAIPAWAEVPVVLADIGPVHSMVARVMDGVGAPGLLMPPGVSPHGHAMRPSEAAALTRADLVVWVGAALAPWMAKAVDSLAEDAVSLELLVAEGAKRSSGDDVTDAEPGHAGHDHGGHDHGDVDPHAWLDPVVGKAWLGRIADTLAGLDPENAIIYQANAEAGQAELDSLQLEIRTRLEPLRGLGFITFHDAYHAFETRFDMPSLGAISVSDAIPASAGQMAELRDLVLESQAVCVFSEPQFDPGLVATLTEGTQARSGVLDPLGAALQPGTTLYPALLRNLSIALEDCLTR